MGFFFISSSLGRRVSEYTPTRSSLAEIKSPSRLGAKKTVFFGQEISGFLSDSPPHKRTLHP